MKDWEWLYFSLRSGRVDITDCKFDNGTAKPSLCGGGGLFFQNDLTLSSCSRGTTSCSIKFIVTNTNFSNNNASFPNRSICPLLNFQNGGGLNVNLYGNAENNTIKVQDCRCESNAAHYWGGGMNLVIANTSRNNNITIENSLFSNNSCKRKGGGGADIGYLFESVTEFPEHNTIQFINTTFEGNYAKFGGGVLVYSTMAESHAFESNDVNFINCRWIKNSARYASAVYLNLNNPGTYNSAGILPKVTFTHGFYEGNMALELSYHNIHKRGKGCFLSIGYKVAFNSNMQFINNSGSALYLASSNVEIKSGSVVTFIGNTGYYGGAIS